MDPLKERWETPDGIEKLAKVIQALQGHDLQWERTLEGLPQIGSVSNGRDLRFAPLRGLVAPRVNFENTHLRGADLSDAALLEANFKRANLEDANLERAKLDEANLEGANLSNTNLNGATLSGASLKGADFTETSLVRVKLHMACLEGTKFHFADLDGSVISHVTIDNQTDFRYSNLKVTRCPSKTRNRLNYNIRRLNWEDWYREHGVLSWPVKAFWWLTDYGTSEARLIGSFFSFAVFFTLLYLSFPEEIHGISPPFDPGISSLECVRALYFSIVTMTTLGFGDIYAEPGHFAGHIILSFQVLLGYLFLGALITRLGILFQSEGPTGIHKQPKQKTRTE